MSRSEPAPHALLSLLLEAAAGRFPSADGGVTFLPGLGHAMSAVVAFTGHAVLATDLHPSVFDDIDLDGYGSALAPRTLLRLAADARIGVHDVTLAARGIGGGDLPITTGWDDHSRVQYARSLRSDVVVHGDHRGFVTLASGLAGRLEMSIEVPGDLHGTGAGRALIGEARRLVGIDDVVFAAVAPGNARSLRAFLSQGFVPIASEVLITPR